jgi:hypothetical protein
VIWVHAGLFVAQATLLGVTWLLVRRARMLAMLATRAGLACAQAMAAANFAERAAACVPFPRREA